MTIRSILVASTLAGAVIPGWLMASTVLIWGDSLSSAYNMPVEQGWASLLQDRVKDRKIKVVNGSIPGETSAGGAQRIDRALEDFSPALVILALGSNDGLQGKDPQELESNLGYIITQSQEAGARVLLLGMKIPPNYGKTYSTQIDTVFLRLADKNGVSFVPFFLETVALDFDYFQADGLHPNTTAQPLLLDHILPELEPLLDQIDDH